MPPVCRALEITPTNQHEGHRQDNHYALPWDTLAFDGDSRRRRLTLDVRTPPERTHPERTTEEKAGEGDTGAAAVIADEADADGMDDDAKAEEGDTGAVAVIADEADADGMDDDAKNPGTEEEGAPGK